MIILIYFLLLVLVSGKTFSVYISLKTPTVGGRLEIAPTVRED